LRSDYKDCVQLTIPDHALHLCDLTCQQKFIFTLICSFCDEKKKLDLPRIELQKMTRMRWDRFVGECRKLQFYDLVKVEGEIGKEIITLV
jgi:hypothetical protein